jgi:hypothetical protein
MRQHELGRQNKAEMRILETSWWDTRGIHHQARARLSGQTGLWIEVRQQLAMGDDWARLIWSRRMSGESDECVGRGADVARKLISSSPIRLGGWAPICSKGRFRLV